MTGNAGSQPNRSVTVKTRLDELSANAHRVLRARYLRTDASGQLETPAQLFRRVAHAVSRAELRFRDEAWASRSEERFFELMAGLDFLPNSPTLMNAGTRLGQLSACFVLPIEDSMEGIFDSLKLMALIQQSGGGTGFSFSRLRPKGDKVLSTEGVASGPVAFMRIFDCATENIRQGGKRRGANMGVLRVDHPDIGDFIEAKCGGTSFQNFNLSVGVTDDFMRAAVAGASFSLRHPRTREVVGTASASELFERIARAAWQSGDPGLLFLDAIERANPLPAIGAIEATNPCGEVPLSSYEACVLGSVNLANVIREQPAPARVDWDKLGAVTELAVRFLDDVIEVNRFPDPRITAIVRQNRKIGLGVMGFSELLIRLGVPYADPAAASIAGELMNFIAEHAQRASRDLARERGVFPNWEHSTHAARGLRLRNATLTSIAPTGTISILAGTSASIEPLFALLYRREHVLGEQVLVELNPLFERHARRLGSHSAELMNALAEHGSLGGIAGVPSEVARLFRTALELTPEDHLRIQAAFQNHVDNAVAKTVNLPADATPEAVANVYRRAWELGLKGVTTYRYGSLARQVLVLGTHVSSSERENFARCDPGACQL